MRFETCFLAVVITLKSVVLNAHLTSLFSTSKVVCMHGFRVFFGVSVCLWADVATQTHRYRHDFSRRERKRGSVVPVEKKKLISEYKEKKMYLERKKRGNKRHVVLV